MLVLRRASATAAAITRCPRRALSEKLEAPGPELLVDPRLVPGCLVQHYPNLFSTAEAQYLFQELQAGTPWKRETDTYGPQDRLTYYAADEGAVFRYVGLTLQPNPWSRALIDIRKKLEGVMVPAVKTLLKDISEQFGSCSLPKSSIIGTSKDSDAAASPLLAGCLLNYYKSGEGFIPWHSDEVRAHGELRIVATVSLGGPRPFLLRRKRPAETESGNDDEPVPLEVLLQPGSVLVMAGSTQEFFEHALPLDEPVDGKSKSPPRISLTFRSIVPGFES